MRHGKAVDLASLYENILRYAVPYGATYVSHTEDAQDIVHDVFCCLFVKAALLPG